MARSYLEVLRTYQWLFITTSLIGATVSAISAFRAPSIYRAAAQLLIERAAPQVVNLPEVLPTGTDSSDYYPTQYGILKSRSLAREVVSQLHLHEHPEFVGRPEEQLFSLRHLLTPLQASLKALLESIGLRPPPTPPQDRRPEALNRIDGSSMPSCRASKLNPSVTPVSSP